MVQSGVLTVDPVSGCARLTLDLGITECFWSLGTCPFAISEAAFIGVALWVIISLFGLGP